MTNLGSKTLIGIAWNFFEQLLQRGLGIVFTLLLAALLTPEDFGLVAMMSVFIAIAIAIMDSGFKQGLIREPDGSQSLFNTAFLANLVLAILAYLLLVLCAPFIAAFYAEPALTTLLRVAGLVVVINAFQVVQSAQLARELNFKRQLVIALPSNAIAGLVAVTMAYNGFGVWALVAQMLTSAAVTTALLWQLQGWRPSADFDFVKCKKLYSFGYKLLLSGLLDVVFKNIYVLFIAKLFSTSVAGLYFFADRIRELLLMQLVKSVQNVTYPALSKLQSDNTALKKGYKNVLLVTSFILSPILLTMAALSHSFFTFLLPDKWLAAADYFSLMCLVSVMYPLHSINLNVLKVKGRSDLFLGIEVLKKVFVVIILYFSIDYGVLGILIGQLFSSVLAYFPNAYFNKKLIGYSIAEQLKDLLPIIMLASAVAVFIAYLSRELLLSPVVSFFLLFSSSMLIYLALAHLFNLAAYVICKEFIATVVNKRLKRI